MPCSLKNVGESRGFTKEVFGFTKEVFGNKISASWLAVCGVGKPAFE
jgi:hypothetical protein